jgi:hypothetical protein
LLLTGEDELISGGVTTDICVYALQKGRLGDQFGAKQQSGKGNK